MGDDETKLFTIYTHGKSETLAYFLEISHSLQNTNKKISERESVKKNRFSIESIL